MIFSFLNNYRLILLFESGDQLYSINAEVNLIVSELYIDSWPNRRKTSCPRAWNLEIVEYWTMEVITLTDANTVSH